MSCPSYPGGQQTPGAADPLPRRVLPQGVCSLALQGLSRSVPGVGEGVLQERI